MSTITNVIRWFLDPAHWTGSDGIPIRLVQHIQLSAECVFIGALIALPIGILLGHYGRAQEIDAHVAAELAEVVRLYGLRNWVEQGYKQVKHELGWADFMVRSDRAIRRHWTLVCCAFAFCWWHEAAEVHLHETVTRPARKKNRPAASPNALLLAAPAAHGTRVADAGALAHALLASVLRQAPAARAGRAA